MTATAKTYDSSPKEAVEEFGTAIITAIQKANAAGVSDRSLYADLMFFAHQALDAQIKMAKQLQQKEVNDNDPA